MLQAENICAKSLTCWKKFLSFFSKRERWIGLLDTISFSESRSLDVLLSLMRRDAYECRGNKVVNVLHAY